MRDDAPQRVNLLIPTIDLEHFFGGYIAKFNLARRLAERGARVRHRDRRPGRPAAARLAAARSSPTRASPACSTRSRSPSPARRTGLEVSRDDRFVATTWWTAHVAARRAAPRSARERFLYLIQEYEPFTFPMGTLAALARASPTTSRTSALFSSELLRDYFRRHGSGSSRRAEAGDAPRPSFQNAITAVGAADAPPSWPRGSRGGCCSTRAPRRTPRATCSSSECSRSAARSRAARSRGWELHGIGTVDGRPPARRSGGGASLDLLPRAAQATTRELLRAHDVGLALMYTPHPSLVPIEMASAGMLTVTNSFENKTAEAMAAISPNLIAAEPEHRRSPTALRRGRRGGRRRRSAGERRQVRWSRDWDTSFGDAD